MKFRDEYYVDNSKNFYEIDEQLNKKIEELQTKLHFAIHHCDDMTCNKIIVKLNQYKNAKQAHIDAYFKDQSVDMYILFRYIKSRAISMHDEDTAAACQIITDLYK